MQKNPAHAQVHESPKSQQPSTEVQKSSAIPRIKKLDIVKR